MHLTTITPPLIITVINSLTMQHNSIVIILIYLYLKCLFIIFINEALILIMFMNEGIIYSENALWHPDQSCWVRLHAVLACKYNMVIFRLHWQLSKLDPLMKAMRCGWKPQEKSDKSTWTWDFFIYFLPNCYFRGQKASSRGLHL